MPKAAAKEPVPREAVSPEPGDPVLAPALEALAAADPDVARAYAACGLPPVRREPPGFATLLNVIMGQQVSKASAAAMVRKLEATCRPVEPAAFLALDEADSRAIGFSRQKWAYARALAADLESGRLDLAGLGRLDDEEAVAHLTQAKGIGRWSAEIYLLFAEGRPDVWPVGDLAIRAAVGRLKGLEERPDEKACLAIGEAWRPHRSAAARFLWHLYRHPGLAT